MAGEFAFLALGLIIGVPIGMALLLRFRNRPRAAREVRLTVTPDSVPRRRSATLATDPFSTDNGSARGGPADTTWYTDPATTRPSTPVRRSAAEAAEPSILMSASPGEPPAREPAQRPVLRTPVRSSVGVPVGRGVDPVYAAIQAEPAAARVPVPVPVPVAVQATRTITPVSNAPEATVEATSIDRLRSVLADDSSRRRAAIDDRRASAMADRRAPSPSVAIAEDVTTGDATGPRSAGAMPASRGETMDRIGGPSGSGSTATAGTSVSISASVSVSPVPVSAVAVSAGPMTAVPASAGPVSASGSGDSSGGPAGGDNPGPGSASIAAPTDDKPAGAPCADERHAVDERCALAERMKTQADEAAAKLRETQREYDVHAGLADAAAALADPRAQRTAKDLAQRSFRSGRASAGTREAVEAAARTWLQEINRINAEAREANSTLTTERAAAAPLLAAIERLTLQADAARVQAESAQASCIVARETLARCEEAQRPSPARMPLEPSLGPGEMPSGRPIPSWAETTAPILGGPVEPEVVDEGALFAATTMGGQPAIFRLLAGDHAVMTQIVADVAGDDPEERRRWQLLLADLVDAIVARAIEACAFEFPADDAFWAPFTRSQARDIALALSSLGYRYDGLGGFAEDRVLTQRDLSLALGYAGLDPMRVRRWPTDPEMAALYSRVTVSADEYLASAAAGLTLGELVSVLGPRADPLTDLWNAWGQVRPYLLEPAERPPRPLA